MLVPESTETIDLHSALGCFDEDWYLSKYCDVAHAVKDGLYDCGLTHFIAHGFAAGNLPCRDFTGFAAFNEAWYLSMYPMASADINAGRAANAKDHYDRLGRFRGYLPNPFSVRPDNPASTPSRFGGLWVDQANALDLIEGRLELGRISVAQADLLRHWRENGYVVLDQAIPSEVIERAKEQVEAAYKGAAVADLRFQCPALGSYGPLPWDIAVQETPAKALDLHWWSPEIRDLIFAPSVREFLELIFERRVLASQSLSFLRGSAQGYHQDTLYVPYSLAMQFAASWIALEDVTVDAGELTYLVGSHRLPDFLLVGKYKTAYDAQRLLPTNEWPSFENYSDSLGQRGLDVGLKPKKFMARKGDVLIWHADLVHGGLPISRHATRLSVVTHYCPKEVAPLYFEASQVEVRDYRQVAWYTKTY